MANGVCGDVGVVDWATGWGEETSNAEANSASRRQSSTSLNSGSLTCCKSGSE
jgi:hypothetical protein